MAVNHYENFPVASVLVPGHMRRAVVDIYRFARNADDIADEGDALAQARLDGLQAYRHALDHLAGQTPDPIAPQLAEVFEPLSESIAKHRLPLQPFYDLLSAFSQDVVITRYDDDAQLFDYCRRSANPVGRLMLQLYDAATPLNLTQADAICTGLQLTNFWQDVAIDWNKDRVYLPQARLAQFGVSEQHIAHGRVDERWQALMRHQVGQARALLLSGYSLPGRLPLRLALELRMVIEGGLRILERLDDLNYDMFNHRPTLKPSDWFVVLGRAIMRRSAPKLSGHA